MTFDDPHPSDQPVTLSNAGLVNPSLIKTANPTFITADDTARYLHERIKQRTEMYFGYVVQRDDGRFLATEPVAEAADSQPSEPKSDRLIFAPKRLPSGYRYAGFFLGRIDDRDFFKQRLPWRSDEDVKRGRKLSLDDETQLLLSIPGIDTIARVTADGLKLPALYFSGPYGSLIKYVRSNSAPERQFSELLSEFLREGEVVIQPDGFDGSAVELVKKMVRVGQFHVLVSSALWAGSRGKLPDTWAPFEGFTATAPVPLEYSWVFSAAETAAAYNHDQLYADASLQLSFMLKSVDAEAYVVTRAVAPNAHHTLSPLQVFAADEQGRATLPSGFELHAVCYAARPQLGLKVAQRWLYESFISPADLAAAIADSRQPGSQLRALYLTTRDGALLKYRFSGSTLEGQLYGVTPTGTITDNGILATLIEGKSTPRQFVLSVAAAGDLSVQQAGTLWDVEGAVDGLWQPFARIRARPLSAGFLSADDAAHAAHEQIGSQRDIEYCGAILQTEDQRFVITQPWPCRENSRFTLASIFPEDHAGNLVLPDGHILYGLYASCTAGALLDPGRMSRYGWSRDEAYVDGQLFTDDELRGLIVNRHQVATAYLSCDENALIAYDLSGSAAELALLKQLEPQGQDSPMERRRRLGDIRPETLVNELAAGGLRIVAGSRLWGRAGTLAEHWRAYPAVQAWRTPEQVACGAIFTDVKAAATDAHARAARGYEMTQTGFAFVLKHARKREYVVTQIVPSDSATPLFSLASLMRTDDNGAFVYPSGFGLYGLFYVRHWMPESLPRHERWLAEHFLSSADLYAAFLVARQMRPAQSTHALPIFISTLDNALLQMQAPVSTELFNPRKQASGLFEDVHTLLAGGQLTAQKFVGEVITSCGLRVIVPNECWDEPGSLTVDWLAYADFNRRPLSPAFFSQADAVRYAQARLAGGRDQVYGGLILKRQDGLFVATEPRPVHTENFDPKWILPDEDVPVGRLAPGMTLVARYRSRRDRLPAFLLADEELAVYRGMFSTEVLAKAFTCNHLWRDEYLLGLDGSVIGFNCSDPDDDLLTAQQKSRRALDRVALLQALTPDVRSPHDPMSNKAEQSLREGRMRPTEFVNQVLKAASMSVIQGSELWGNVQKLPRGWLPAHAFVAPEDSPHATADRACTPVFRHRDDVARYVHGRAGERRVLTFGFIVKANNGHWLASLPVNGEDLRFPLDRVWLRGQLPPHCTVQAVYVCAPARQPDELRASPVYRSFITPSTLRAALFAVRQSSPAGDTFLPIFLSCTDGALLRYQALVHDSDWDSQSRLQAYVKTLNGPFNPGDYIHKVARAGTLDVLVSGEIWATQGPVTQEWQPRVANAYLPDQDERVPLGPVFSHADDAARYQWRRYRPQPGKAWLGALLENTRGPIQTWLVTEPVDDSGPSVAVGLRRFTPAYSRLFVRVMNQQTPFATGQYPQDFRVMGVQQLHKVDDSRQRLPDRYEEALGANFIAQQEFRAFVDMFRLDNVAGARYYFTPRNGALLVYRPSYQRSEREMLLSGWLDPETDQPKSLPSQVITALALSGRLYVLEPDTFWQPRGQVGPRLLMELRKAGLQ
jgi:hypothetical protein